MGEGMLGCEMIWGIDEAQKVRGLVEEATGEQCPCVQGRACPLIPAENPWREPERERIAV